LIEEDGCLWIADANSWRALLLFPDDYTAVDREGVTVVIDGTGAERARIGQPVVVFGGGITAEVARRLSDEPLPARCLADDIWLVSDLTSGNQ
jgi:hypothetical protein